MNEEKEVSSPSDCDVGDQPLVQLPREAAVAAKWWADRLRNGAKQQMVSPEERVMRPGSTQETDIAEVLTMIAGRSQQVLSPEQIDEFEAILGAIIVKRYIETDGWERAKNEPNWGSATRIVMTDYGACDELRAAFQSAGGGLKCDSVFPIKTVMWINPGSVKVRYGYGAAEEELLVS